jgi:uncharacterized protein
MRQQLPKEIDPFRFANTGREIEGEVELAKLSRLSEVLADTSGTVKIAMQFDVDDTGTPFMKGHFETVLSLTCERCMQAMQMPMSIDTWLGLVKHEKLIDALADQYEAWVIEDTNTPIDPILVVEDELILALPLVPKHDSDCLPKEALESKDDSTKNEVPDKPASPFAVLADLKSKK